MSERPPVTKKVKQRPVWRRFLQRTLLNTEEFWAPTEEEKYDAIRVLEDPSNEALPGLWLEAHRILDEA